MVKSIRREVEARGGHVLLWDAGDAEERSLLESDVTKGGAVMALLSAVGYDAAALGNAAVLSYGPQNLRNLANEASFPILAANLFWAESGSLVEGAQPYQIVEIEGIKLGVIGFTALFRLYAIFGVDVADPAPIAAKLRDELHQRGAKIIVVLSHLSSEADQQLAKAVDGLDLIIGGHDHVAFHEPLIINDALISQAGDHGEYLGRIDLEIDVPSGKILRREAQLLPVRGDVMPDPVVVKAIAAQRERVRALLDEPIGELLTPLDLAFDRECGMGDFLADVLRERMGADVAVVITGSLSAGLEAGMVTLGDLCRACSAPGNPARAELTGAQILGMLRHGFDPETCKAKPPPLRGNPQGILQVSGLKVRYDPDAPSEERIKEVLVHGQPLEPGLLYTVAATDWEFNERTGYVSVSQEEVTYEVPTVLREAMQDYLARHSPLSVDVGGRIEKIEGR
jgi:2',3'-cyclic-nucleotide 2'-phosphodiesterase (5'-nucleotidase family)